MSYQWVEWAQRIQALSQSGLAFSKDNYDIERYEELRIISAEIMQEHTGLEMQKIKDFFLNDTGYQTPKVDVRGVIFQDDKILMVKEKLDDRWSLPGGFCDIGLSAAENIIKEIKEESGYDAVPTKLLAVWDKNKHPHPPEPFHYYKLFIQCDIIGGQPEKGIETSDIKFFSESDIPDLSANRVVESQIRTIFEFSRDPNKETLFD